MDFEASPIAVAPAPPADWQAVKGAILAKLDLVAEYEALGVVFSAGSAKSNGVRECHAVDRPADNPDVVPSAFVNLKSGIYHDSGNGGVSLNFWDFALAHGGHGRHIDVVRHYAAKAGIELGRISPGKGGRVREAVYEYYDSGGELRYAVFRYRLPSGAKTFTQHPPDGRGGWKFGAGCMDGVEPLPYRLLDLIAADPEEPVWVVEGEKDADRIAALGLIATTNHQGSGSTDKTWPKFLAHFRGRVVFVIPDHDTAGWVHARKVANYLDGVASVVKVVELPDAGPVRPKHGIDISDWLDLGHDLDELGKAAYTAPVWSPAQPDPVATAGAAPDADPDRDATAADLRDRQAAETWLWPLHIPPAALTILAAEPGTGKTRFCFDLQRRITLGLPWPDGSPMTVPPGARVLWVVADNQWGEMVDIPASFGIPDDQVVLNAPASDPYSGTSLQSDEEIADFEARILRVKPALVFIDTITNSGDFKVESANEAKRQYKPLQEIAQRTGIPIVCVTHLNTAGKVLGRRAIEKARVVIQMSCPDPEGQPTRRKLWVEKSKALKPPPLGVTMGDEGNEYDTHPPEAPAPAERREGARGPAPVKANECARWLRDYLAANGRSRVATTRRAAEEAGFPSASTIYKAVEMLGVVEDGEKGGKHWSLPNGENGHAAPF